MKALFALKMGLVSLIIFFCQPTEVSAGSIYVYGTSEGPFIYNGTNYMDVDLHWSHSNANKYDAYIFCWRTKENNRKGKDPCNYNKHTSRDQNISFTASDQKFKPYPKVYKYRIRARKSKNGKWVNLMPSIISRPCFYLRSSGINQIQHGCL